jgi:hypothetical protein
MFHTDPFASIRNIIFATLRYKTQNTVEFERSYLPLQTTKGAGIAQSV